jgi:hypothetical protein
VTPDPVGFSDGPNLYAYVHNSPVVLIDPYGLMAMEDEEGAGINDPPHKMLIDLEKMRTDFGKIPEIGREFLSGDFSRVRDAPWAEIAERIVTNSPEVLLAVAAMSPMGRTTVAARAGFTALGGTRVGFACRGLATRVLSWARGVSRSATAVQEVAEGRLAISMAAKATTKSEIGLVKERCIRDLKPASIANAAKNIEYFLGGKGKVITNAGGDTILMRDNKKIRFDIKDPHGDKPHFHLEERSPDGKWTDSTPEHRYYFTKE